MSPRIRVERAGTRDTGYGPGWFAIPGDWFPTWTDAMEYATGGPLVSEATA